MTVWASALRRSNPSFVIIIGIGIGIGVIVIIIVDGGGADAAVDGGGGGNVGVDVAAGEVVAFLSLLLLLLFICSCTCTCSRACACACCCWDDFLSNFSLRVINSFWSLSLRCANNEVLLLQAEELLHLLLELSFQGPLRRVSHEPAALGCCHVAAELCQSPSCLRCPARNGLLVVLDVEVVRCRY